MLSCAFRLKKKRKMREKESDFGQKNTRLQRKVGKDGSRRKERKRRKEKEEKRREGKGK